MFSSQTMLRKKPTSWSSAGKQSGVSAIATAATTGKSKRRQRDHQENAQEDEPPRKQRTGRITQTEPTEENEIEGVTLFFTGVWTAEDAPDSPVRGLEAEDAIDLTASGSRAPESEKPDDESGQSDDESDKDDVASSIMDFDESSAATATRGDEREDTPDSKQPHQANDEASVAAASASRPTTGSTATATVPAAAVVRRAPVANVAAINRSRVAAAAASDSEEEDDYDQAVHNNQALLAEYGELFDQEQTFLEDPIMEASNDLLVRQREFEPIPMPSENEPSYMRRCIKWFGEIKSQNKKLRKKIKRQRTNITRLSSLRESLQAWKKQTDSTLKKLQELRTQSNSKSIIVNREVRTKQQIVTKLRQAETHCDDLRAEAKVAQERVESSKSNLQASLARAKSLREQLVAEEEKASAIEQTVKSSEQESSELHKQAETEGKKARAAKNELESVKSTIQAANEELENLGSQMESTREQEQTEREQAKVLCKQVDRLFRTSE